MPNKKPVLVVLAAGMGSRYGGLKQLDTFTPENDTLIDLSLYDAFQAGFGKVIFVIRNSFKDDFEPLFSEKLKDKIDIRFVYQELDNIPEKFLNSGRTKPWGTGHALLCTQSEIDEDENFVVINADDFYGREAYKSMATHLSQIDPSTAEYSMMGYQLINTISEFGSVSRGECFVNEEGYLNDIIERTEIYENDNILVMNVDNEPVPIPKNTTVSMNFWGFTPKIFTNLEGLFNEFLEQNSTEPKTEFYIPSVVNLLLKDKMAKVKVLTSSAKWMGVTYPNDKEDVIRKLGILKSEKVYPKFLWQ